MYSPISVFVLSYVSIQSIYHADKCRVNFIKSGLSAV